MKITDNILVMNFKWSELKMAGLIFFEMKDIDALTGGWWFENDITEEKLDLKNMVAPSTVTMTQITLVRNPIEYPQYPKWAKQYFEQFE